MPPRTQSFWPNSLIVPWLKRGKRISKEYDVFACDCLMVASLTTTKKKHLCAKPCESLDAITPDDTDRSPDVQAHSRAWPHMGRPRTKGSPSARPRGAAFSAPCADASAAFAIFAGGGDPSFSACGHSASNYFRVLTQRCRWLACLAGRRAEPHATLH